MRFAVFIKPLPAEIQSRFRSMRSLFLSLLITAGGFLLGRPGLAQGQVPVQDSGDGTLSGLPERQALTDSRVVNGSVLDPSGATIVGAQVTLTRVDGNPVAHTTTGNTGDFRFNKVSRGNYHIEVQAEGFRMARIDVILGRKPPAPLRVVMAIASQRQVVTVQASDSSPQ